MPPWKLLDHPADMAIEGRGDTPEAALAAVVEGLLAELGPPPAEPGQRVGLTVDGLDRDETLVSALNELLYRINVRGEGLDTPEVVTLGETRLELRIGSAPRPPGCQLETEVKAATYHDLELSPVPSGGWRLRVVFDV